MCSNPWFKKINNKWQSLPCGHCLACRIDSLILWQNRCNIEYIKGRSAFVTFTYDDNHLHYNENAIFPTLNKDEIHRYLDNIHHKINKLPLMPALCRKNYHFFVAGEYGDSFQRPHAHILFFGLDFQDMKNLFINSWKNGSVKSLPVSQGGIRYVVDYMTKNLTGVQAEQEYDNMNRERPFKKVSRGLGSEFFFAHSEEINDTGYIKQGSRLIPIPAYYKNLLRYVNEDSLKVCDKLKLYSYRNLEKEGKSLGFSDFDSYIRYKRKATELSIYKRMLNKGIPCFPSYNDFESVSDGYTSKIF